MNQTETNRALGKSFTPITNNNKTGLTDGLFLNKRPFNYWATDGATFPKSVTVNLGKAIMINAVRFQAYGMSAPEITVLVGRIKKEIAKVVTVKSDNSKLITVYFDAKYVKYVRLDFLSSGYKNNKCSINELQVFHFK
jgi:hypothetical protein